MWKHLLHLILLHATNVHLSDIGKWVQQLNVQKCAIVQTGNGMCALFLESEQAAETTEYYLGSCDCKTMARWQWCGMQLKKARPWECTFDFEQVNAGVESARVHRRLCDLTGIAEWAEACNCTSSMVPVVGFPTCVAAKHSICESNVCGTAKCTSAPVTGLVLKVKCSKKCHQKQPFCERLGPKSSQTIKISGRWTDFQPPTCQSGNKVSVSRCVDVKNGTPAFDCLGPGTMCCPATNDQCTCSVSHQNACLVVTRTTSFCVT